MSLSLSTQEVRRSGGAPAAINGENRSIDKTGIFGREKGNSGGEFFRRSDPRGLAGLEKRTHSGQPGFTWDAISDTNGGRDRPRADRIAANTPFPIWKGKHLGKSH